MIYADNNGSCPLHPKVVEYLSTRLASGPYANPNSIHSLGRKMNMGLEKCRRACAKSLGAKSSQLTFNSGSSEGISHVFHSVLSDSTDDKNIIIKSGLEHACVANAAAYYAEKRNYKVEIVNSLPSGIIDIQHLNEILKNHKNKVALVALMAANNETGVIQPYKQIGLLCKSHGAEYLCDTTQYIGKVQDFNFDGYPDVFITGVSNTGVKSANLYYNQGDGNFTPDVTNFPGLTNGGVTIADFNQNGIQDLGEPGLENIQVNLLNSAGNPVMSNGNPVTTTTNSGGFYEFAGLTTGNYIVEVVVPSGTSISPQNAGSNDGLDSDVSTTTNRTGLITVSTNSLIDDVDIGLVNVISARACSDAGELFVADETGNIGRYNATTGAVIDASGNLDAIDSSLGAVSFRHHWNSQWRSNFIFSGMNIDNNTALTGTGVTKTVNSFQINLLHSPVPKLTLGFGFLTPTDSEVIMASK